MSSIYWSSSWRVHRALVKKERQNLLFYSYCLSALLVLIILSVLEETQFPLFTFILVSSSLAIAIVKKDLGNLGLTMTSFRSSFSPATICFLLIIIPIVIIEPYTHTFEHIIHLSMNQTPPDIAFVWFRNATKISQRIGTFAYLGLIGVFAEELLFRGFLIQYFKIKVGFLAILIQALPFMLLNAIVVFVIAPIDSAIYLFCYTLPLCSGLGWCSYKTNSIWPGVISLNLANFLYYFLLIDIL